MKQVITKIRYDKKADRIGPDCPFTHWKLYFKKSMLKLCRKKFASFGEESEFRPYAYAINCSKIKIGKKTVIRPNSMLFADIRNKEKGWIIIEDEVLIGSGVHIYVSNHKFGKKDTPVIAQGHFEPENTILESGCWIGANSIVLPGVTIGRNSVVGAGSVVTRDVPANTVAIGSPARIVKKITE